MKYLLLLCAAVMFAACAVAQNVAKAGKHHVVLKTLSVSYVDSGSVTRVGVVMEGIPNTSSRVDSVTVAADGHRLRAVDIDGVDFNRYFQWEETGELYVEVDFPGRISREGTLVFHTVHGDVCCNLMSDNNIGGNRE